VATPSSALPSLATFAASDVLRCCRICAGVGGDAVDAFDAAAAAAAAAAGGAVSCIGSSTALPLCKGTPRICEMAFAVLSGSVTAAARVGVGACGDPGRAISTEARAGVANAAALSRTASARRQVSTRRSMRRSAACRAAWHVVTEGVAVGREEASAASTSVASRSEGRRREGREGGEARRKIRKPAS